MINIANRHPKLHLFQVVTDFMKTDVGMHVYHPDSHPCMHTFCTTIPTSSHNFLIVFYTCLCIFFIMIIHFITDKLSRNILYDYVYVYTVCTHSYTKSIYTVSLPIQLICSVYLLAWGEPALDQRAVIFAIVIKLIMTLSCYL